MSDNTRKDHLLTEREVSLWLGISEPTLFRHRRNGTAPRHLKLSPRRLAYRRADVEEWLASRECSKPSLDDEVDLEDRASLCPRTA